MVGGRRSLRANWFGWWVGKDVFRGFLLRTSSRWRSQLCAALKLGGGWALLVLGGGWDSIFSLLNFISFSIL